MQKAMRTGVHGHRTSLILAVGLVCVFGAGSVAVAATDKEITEKVKSAIAADPVLSQRNIAVSTYKGRVLLQGEVPYEREADKAVGLANSVEEVRSVQNNFVGYLPHVTDSTARDKDISEKVKAALASDPMVGQRDIKVSTYKGRVQLLGNVPTQREADRAVDLAKNVDETLSVQNDLLGYLPPLAFGTAGDKDATEKVKQSIAADAVLSQRQIKVNTLEGRVFLTSDGSILASNPATSKIQGNLVDLTSENGSIGSIASPLTVNVGYTGTMTQRGFFGLKAQAAGDIGIETKAWSGNSAGDLLVNTVVSTGGDGNGEGAGVNRVTMDMATMIAQVPAILESLTGVKIADLLTQVRAFLNRSS